MTKKKKKLKNPSKQLPHNAPLLNEGRNHNSFSEPLPISDGQTKLESKSQGLHFIESAALWVSVAALIVAIAGVLVSQGQLSVMSRQIRLAEIDQRAWIAFENDFVLEQREDTLDIKINFSNVGKTPAIIQEYSINAAYLKDSPLTPDYEICKYRRDRVLLPNVKALNACIIDTPRGAGQLYVYAQVIYKDIFGEEHFTHYCKFIRKDRITEFCQTYNDTDDEPIKP